MKSVLGKYWQQKETDDAFVLQIARHLGISDLLARLVSQRVTSVEEAENYISPKLRNLLPDPFHLLDMDKAVARVINAINNKEKICLFADYDVDGATSAALLKNIFNQLNIISDIYIPDRIEEGYGPTSGAMEKISKTGASLLITLDCGSVAFEALEHAFLVGLDTIVIDHHLSLETLPKAVAVINPNRLDEVSNCRDMAAVGVAFLFAVALCSELKRQNFFVKNNLTPPDLMANLDLVALGTVCDVMRLTGINRAFVAQGLKVARARGNIGYAALCDVAGIEEAISCYHLGFIIGPRINAGGRVGQSSLGAKLLSTKSKSEAKTIALELDVYNNERKTIELLMIEEAELMAREQANEPMIFVANKGWHPGVIGIVAGRLKEKYNKPVAVIALNDCEGKASCRSVKGVDFGAKILNAKIDNLLISGGGHYMAAGFTVHKDKLTELHNFLTVQIAKDLQGSEAHLTDYYSIQLSSDAATTLFVKELEKLEPFGNGNPTPIVKFSNLYVLKADVITNKHIKILFAPIGESYSSKPLHAIAFNAAGTPIADVIMSQKSRQLSVFGSLKINKWQDKETVQLQLSDVIIEST